MKFDCEYTVTIKLSDVYMREGHSSDELREKIMLLGKENLKRYFNNTLFDPDKKVIFEDTKFELKKI
jgi:hypothetical protein